MDALNTEVRRLLKKYDVEDRTDSTVTLRRRSLPAGGHVVCVLLSILTAGLFLPVYLLIAVINGKFTNHSLYLELQDDGSVRKTKIRR